MTTNAKYEDLILALREINRQYDENITFRRLSPLDNDLVLFNLRVKKPGTTGAVIKSGKKAIGACWHVHGLFFETLFILDPNVKIKAVGRFITRDNGNWQPFKFQGCEHSTSCNCHN